MPFRCTAWNPHGVCVLTSSCCRAFDSKGNHKLNVNEFVELHRFLSAVTDAFTAVAKGSKTITAADAPQVLARLGKSPGMTQRCTQRIGTRNQGKHSLPLL